MQYVSQKNRKRNKKAKQFLEPAALQAAVLECQANNNEPSVKVCIMFRDIIDHLILHKNWHSYNEDFKQDMKSYALERMIKGIRTFKLNPDNKRCNCFSYFTRAAEMAFLALVIKRSKERERYEKFLNEQMSKLRAEFPSSKFLEKLDNEYSEDYDYE